jgi:hypothetical protein
MVELKLYVWENVLTDYTEGIVCVLAHNEEEAWALLQKEDDTAWWVLQGSPDITWQGAQSEEINKLSKSEIALKALQQMGKFKFETAINPQEIIEPVAFAIWGGG